MSLPLVAMEGRLVVDPDLRFSPSGVAVSTFRMAANSRKRNEAGEWVDDQTLYLRIVCFRQLAEHVAESLVKGDTAVVSGRIHTNEWEDEQGQKRSEVELVADSVAASLQFRTIPHGAGRVDRTPGSSAPAGDQWSAPAGDDPPF
jgi:single-strand DNA-binding protein